MTTPRRPDDGRPNPRSTITKDGQGHPDRSAAEREDRYLGPACQARTVTRSADGADLVELGSGKYLRLTTFRRDGRPVSTPVWPVVDRADLGGVDQQLLVTTGAETGKVKRLRHTPRVLLAPCDARGSVTAGVEDLEAVAEVQTDVATYRRARSLLVRRHPFLSGRWGWYDVLQRPEHN